MAGLVSAPDPVAAELRLWASTPFDPAKANCGQSVIAYVERATGRRSRAVRQLGPIRTACIWASRDRFIAFGRDALAELGCAETDNPLRGDVGLVELPVGLTAALCLCDAGAGKHMWAARGNREVVIDAAAPVIAWRVPCLKP